MHPNRGYRWEDRAAMRLLVAELGFGALFAATSDGPRVAHLPVVWLDDTTLGLHIARGNALTRHLDDATALFVAQGPDGYISPDWYGTGPDEVPTWNYVAVELEGVLRRMERGALVAQIEQLGAEQEARLPKDPWRLDKVSPQKVAALLNGIVGYRLEIQAWRGTLKLAQGKSAEARLAAADGVEAAGRRGIAHWMRAL